MKPLGDNITFEEVEINHSAPGGKVLVVKADRKNDDGEYDRLTAGVCLDMGTGQWDVSGTQWLDPAKKVAKGKPYLLNKTGNYHYQIGMKKYLICRMSNVVAELEPSEIKQNG